MLKRPSPRAWREDQRAAEIEKVCNGFVTPGKANREIYRVIIECLFPPGSGMPGPVKTRDEIRRSVDAIKPGYKDVFRRVREMQGEEGLHGLVKEGTQYQLQHTAVSAKREPRRPIPASVGRSIAISQGSRCTICGGPISINGGRIDVDHRVPRLRGGTSYEGNLQVICATCNNSKSTQCSNCVLDCNTCGWAFPERYRPVRLRPDVVLRLHRLANEQNRTADDIANELLEKAL